MSAVHNTIGKWDQEGTPGLDEFLVHYRSDDNIWWMVSCGHHLNLFESAIEEIDRLQGILDNIRAVCDQHEECDGGDCTPGMIIHDIRLTWGEDNYA